MTQGWLNSAWWENYEEQLLMVDATCSIAKKRLFNMQLTSLLWSYWQEGVQVINFWDEEYQLPTFSAEQLSNQEIVVNEAIQKFEASVLAVLKVSSSRHTTSWEDVAHLEELESKFLRGGNLDGLDVKQLAKIRAIKIHPEHIEIAGYKLRRFDESCEWEILLPGIFVPNLHIASGLSFELAKKYIDKVGFQIISESQLRAIIKAIPTESPYSMHDLIKNTMAILNLKHLVFGKDLTVWGYWTREGNVYWSYDEQSSSIQTKQVTNNSIHFLRCII